MPTVTVSEEYQIELPEDVRRQMDVKPGQKFEVVVEGDEIYMVRVPQLSELRGIAKGMDLSDYRDEEDRF